MDILFVKISIQYVKHVHATAPISTVNWCYWNNWNLMKRVNVWNNTSLVGTRTHDPSIKCRLLYSRCGTGMWHFPIHCLGYWLWRYGNFVLKVNIRNSNYARASAPVSTVNSFSWNNRNFMEWKMAPPWWELEPIPRLHSEWSNHWATGMLYFPIHGLGYWF